MTFQHKIKLLRIEIRKLKRELREYKSHCGIIVHPGKIPPVKSLPDLKEMKRNPIVGFIRTKDKCTGLYLFKAKFKDGTETFSLDINRLK